MSKKQTTDETPKDQLPGEVLTEGLPKSEEPAQETQETAANPEEEKQPDPQDQPQETPKEEGNVKSKFENPKSKYIDKFKSVGCDRGVADKEAEYVRVKKALANDPEILQMIPYLQEYLGI